MAEHLDRGNHEITNDERRTEPVLRLRHRMRRHIRIQEATAGVLKVLLEYQNQALFLSDVARLAGREPNVVAPILKRLADDGWAEQSPDPVETYQTSAGPKPRIRYRLEPQRGRLWAEQRLQLARVTGVRVGSRRLRSAGAG